MFGRVDSARWGTSDAKWQSATHRYVLAWVACEYDHAKIWQSDIPNIIRLPGIHQFSDGPEHLKAGDPALGRPFRDALLAWLINPAGAGVALWNDALEAPAWHYGGAPEDRARVLAEVETPWAAEALREAYRHADRKDREIILLRAENKALRVRDSVRNRFLDVGHLLAHAAWMADWLSGEGKEDEEIV